MKCADFLSWRATGPWWCRLRAWRHGRRCPRCRTVAQALDAWQEALRAAEPLPGHLRAAWSASWTEDAAPRTLWTPRLATLVVAGGAVTALVVVRLLVSMKLEPPVQPAPLVSQHESLVAPVVPTRPRTEARFHVAERLDGPRQVLARGPTPELKSLLRDVDALQTDVSRVAAQAELLDARRQADAMLVKYGQW